MPEHSELTKQPSSADHDLVRASNTARKPDQDQVRPTPEQADKIIASKLGGKVPSQSPADMGAVGPPSIDVGDHQIGSQSSHETIVWNTEAVEANVIVHVEGDPAFQLVSVPDRIFPSRDGVDPNNKIKFVFSPTSKGRVTGALRVNLSWRSGARSPTELIIPIAGGAHAAGAPTLAEEMSETERQERAQRERVARETASKRAAAHEDQAWNEPTPQHPDGWNGWDQKLNDATASTQRALKGLYEMRARGVSIAQAEAAAYTRQQPPHEDSILTALAKLGLDIATAGIAGYIGKRLEGPLERILSTTIAAHSAPKAGQFAGRAIAESKTVASKPLIALFTDAVKQGVKSAGKPLQLGAHSHDSEGFSGTRVHSKGALSESPLLDFFGREDNALTADGIGEAEQIAKRTRNELEPMLNDKEHARHAVDAMNAVTQGILESFAWATQEQSQSSAVHWVRYLAQASLGSISPGTARAERKGIRSDEALTDISGANAAPSSAGSPRGIEGLVDIEFAASATHPETPATVKSVYVKGASNIIARRLANESLLQAHMPARGHGTPSDGDAVMPVTVVRDEAGNLEYTDDTGAPGIPSRWLARKGGELHGGREAELRGARKLMEDDLMSRPIDIDLIKTDSADDPKGVH